VYQSIEALQTDLDAYLAHYNGERPHQGRWCYGKTPTETFLDSGLTLERWHAAGPPSRNRAPLSVRSSSFDHTLMAVFFRLCRAVRQFAPSGSMRLLAERAFWQYAPSGSTRLLAVCAFWQYAPSGSMRLLAVRAFWQYAPSGSMRLLAERALWQYAPFGSSRPLAVRAL
jgi:hypothetical protein